MYAILAAIIAAYSAAPKAEAPKRCSVIVDEAAEIVHGAVDILAKEVQKREDANPQKTHELLSEYVLNKQPIMRKLREKAHGLSLEKADIKACENHAKQAFFTSLRQLSSAGSLFYHRTDTFQMIGDLMR